MEHFCETIPQLFATCFQGKTLRYVTMGRDRLLHDEREREREREGGKKSTFTIIVTDQPVTFGCTLSRLA